ncbi:CpxP family protein [Grimontia kaedaensis]|uniref:Periplasmic protein CpxP n=2 Tax=Grimontia TaxID=246861 RepID=A0A128FDB4_9GAMM|nr:MULTISPECIES: CpxP family protein [Grimontia]USH02616.1 CpxP family protein [Grimontia kaedaensis]CZF84485.1 Periplasmic protein CpxP precursor [Grimontia celer]
MKFSKRIAATVIALPLMMGSMSAMAFGGKHHDGEGMHGGKGMMGKHLLRGVDLTDEQKAELKTLREQKREDMKASKGEFRTQMMADRQQMQALMLADNFDEAAVRALAEKMVDQQVERRVAMMKGQHEMMTILTPEQKVQVKENMDKMAERMQKRMEKRG